MTSKKKQEPIKKKQTTNEKGQEPNQEKIELNVEKILKLKAYLKDRLNLNECLASIGTPKWVEYPNYEKYHLLKLVGDILSNNKETILIDFEDKFQYGILTGEVIMIKTILEGADGLDGYINKLYEFEKNFIGEPNETE